MNRFRDIEIWVDRGLRCAWADARLAIVARAYGRANEGPRTYFFDLLRSLWAKLWTPTTLF